MRKYIAAIMLVLFLAVPAMAEITKEINKFQTCIKKLDRKITIENGKIRVDFNYENLINYMVVREYSELRILQQIAIEWDRNVEFPDMKISSDPEWKEQLIKAIQTYEARIIYKIATEIILGKRAIL